MATWRQVVYDIYTDLKQAFDDAEISLNHVKYWVAICGSRLLVQHIDKRDSGAFLSVFHDIHVHTDAYGYKYIDLPEVILDYDKDSGIEYVSYDVCVDNCTPPFTSVQFTRISPSAARILYYTEEEKPSPESLIIDKLNKIDPLTMTPIDALNSLYELKKDIDNNK